MFQRAVELAKTATELMPQEGKYQRTLGLALYRNGDWKGAVAALEKSAQLASGGDGEDWILLAMAHWQLGHKAEARKWADKAFASLKKDASKNERLRWLCLEAQALGLKENP